MTKVDWKQGAFYCASSARSRSRSCSCSAWISSMTASECFELAHVVASGFQFRNLLLMFGDALNAMAHKPVGYIKVTQGDRSAVHPPTIAHFSIVWA